MSEIDEVVALFVAVMRGEPVDMNSAPAACRDALVKTRRAIAAGAPQWAAAQDGFDAVMAEMNDGVRGEGRVLPYE